MKVEKMVKKGWVVLATVMLTASSGYAANVETMGVGSMNTAQAGAVSAYCDNVFAAYYNPAGLSLIEKPTMSAGGIYYNAKIKVYDWHVNDAGGNKLTGNTMLENAASDYQSDTMNIFSPSLGFAMPVTDKITLGVAAYTPYGLHVTWDKDPVKSPSSAYAWESYYGRITVNPTLAYKVSDKFSVGIGVSLGRSVCEAGKTLTFGDNLKSDPKALGAWAMTKPAIAKKLAPMVADPSPEQKALAGEALTLGVRAISVLDGARLKMESTDDFNYSFNAGIMYRPVESLSFGLTYRGRTDTKFEGDVTISKEGLPTMTGTVEMEYDHPEQVQGGVRWFATKKLQIEADVTWTGWGVNENQDENTVITVPDSVMATALNNMSPELQKFAKGLMAQGLLKDGELPVSFHHGRDWDDTTSFRLGVNYQATEALTLRAGYIYDPSPVPDETFEFGWPDTDRNVYTLGSGWRFNERWQFDAVLQYVISTSHRPTTGGSSELNGNYATAYGTSEANTKVYCKDEGILYGAGVTLTYTF